MDPATYRDDVENGVTAVDGGATTTNTTEPIDPETKIESNGVKDDDEPMLQSEDNNLVSSDENELKISPKKISETTEEEDDEEDEEDDDDDEEPPAKKQKPLSLLATPTTPKSNPMVQHELQDVQLLEASQPEEIIGTPVTESVKSGTKSSGKKSAKKKNNINNVWTRPSSRKGKKKAKSNQNNGNGNGNSNNNNNNNASAQPEDKVLITPIPRFPDKNDDNPEMKICLSKFYKAEKVEIGEDRMIAGSTKGYRMVRATRGVLEGAWYFEIKVARLGETGHTRLGWSTDKGDLQAPVGFDANSFGYRDVDGSKVHKALRENYGEEGYKEGDVLGFYISLPEGNLYAPNPPRYVWYKGQRYVCAPDPKEDPPKVVPGSEICFFKNGICQGTAFKDLYGGRYYPAASMYTLPNQPNCVVRFNFGPDFDFFPEDFGERPAPRPMIEVPYHGIDGKIENGITRSVVTEEQGTPCSLPVVTEEQAVTPCPLPVETEEQGVVLHTLPDETEEQGTLHTLPVVVTEEQGPPRTLPVVTEEQGTLSPLPVVTEEQNTLQTLPVETEQGAEVVEPSDMVVINEA